MVVSSAGPEGTVYSFRPDARDGELTVLNLDRYSVVDVV